MSHCPECHAFISVPENLPTADTAIYCRNCGFTCRVYHLTSSSPVVDLVAGTRRADTRPFVDQGAAFQNGPKGNSLNELSNLQPNGKIKKSKQLQPNALQMFLFSLLLFTFLCSCGSPDHVSNSVELPPQADQFATYEMYSSYGKHKIKYNQYSTMVKNALFGGSK